MFDHTIPALPRARVERLLTRAVPDGLIVYDTDRHQAHSLNHTAALVWQRCDGRTTVPELSTLLSRELDLPADEALIWLALSRLEQAHLLCERVTPGGGRTGLPRRTAIRKLGIAGIITALLPMVETLAAPAPADAASATIARAQLTSSAVGANSSTTGQTDPGPGSPTGSDPPSDGGDNNGNKNGQNQDSQEQGSNGSDHNGSNDNGSGNDGPGANGPSDRPGGGNGGSSDSADQGKQGGSPGGAGQTVFKAGTG